MGASTEPCSTTRVACTCFDGIALREYAYELDGTGAGRVTAVADEDRVRGQRAIRETVEGIARLYRPRQ